MGESFLDKRGGGGKIKGLIKEYYVYAGETINADSFVKFVNGISGITTQSSSSVGIETTTARSGEIFSACKLSETKVFIAHSYTTSRHMYGTVVNISNTTLTAGTSVALRTSSYGGYSISAVALSSTKVFIAHCYNTNLYVYGMVCTISGTTITAGTDTDLGCGSSSAYQISSVMMDSSKVVVVNNDNGDMSLAAVVCTISGTTITPGTNTEIQGNDDFGNFISATKLSSTRIFISNTYSSRIVLFGTLIEISGTTVTEIYSTQLLPDQSRTGDFSSAVALSEDTVFVAHCEGSNITYLYGIIVKISNNTFTIGTDTQLTTAISVGEVISAVKVTSSKVFVAYHYNGGGTSTIDKLSGMNCAVSGTTITPGSAISLNANDGTGLGISALLLDETLGTVFVAHRYDKTNMYLYGRLVNAYGSTPSSSIRIKRYETQVANATSSSVSGVSITAGTGGTSTAHKDKIQIYVPNV